MPVGFATGTSPLVLTFPYVGTDIAPQLYNRLSSSGKSLIDTDWHLRRLFDGIIQNDTQVYANFSRVLADVNAFPGAKGTAGDDRPSMIALTDSKNRSIWCGPPRAAEIRSWQSAFFVPYHAALAAHLARVRAQHGHAILLDCIVHRNMTGDGPEAHFDVAAATRMAINCDTMLASNVVSRMQAFEPPRAGFDNRFGTGWTVHSNGKPKAGIHAMQLRLSPQAFLDSTEEPWPYSAEKAQPLRDLLNDALVYLRNWTPERKGGSLKVYAT